MSTRTIPPGQQDRLIAKVQDLHAIKHILDGDAQDFVERVMASQHIHWPFTWAVKINEFHDRYYGN